MALGGKVHKNPSRKFVFGSEEIQSTAILSSKPYIRAILGENAQNCHFRIIQSHGDCVISLPERDDVQLLAKSSTCDVEMFAVGENTIAFQGHPELTVDLCLEKIYPDLTANKVLQGEEAQAAVESLKKPLDHDLFVDVLKNFLHS